MAVAVVSLRSHEFIEDYSVIANELCVCWELRRNHTLAFLLNITVRVVSLARVKFQNTKIVKTEKWGACGEIITWWVWSIVILDMCT